VGQKTFPRLTDRGPFLPLTAMAVMIVVVVGRWLLDHISTVGYGINLIFGLHDLSGLKFRGLFWTYIF
jgi:hypothetical protein